MTQSELMTVHVDGAEKVISFSHNHINDMTTALQIAGHVGEMMERSDGPGEHAWETLKVDFQRVRRVSSVALNQLIGIQRQAAQLGDSAGSDECSAQRARGVCPDPVGTDVRICSRHCLCFGVWVGGMTGPTVVGRRQFQTISRDGGAAGDHHGSRNAVDRS